MWLQKLFAQLISIKVWVMILLTILLYITKLTGLEYAGLMGTILAFKGAFQVSSVWKRSGADNNAVDKT
jgi:hypothetical protein